MAKDMNSTRELLEAMDYRTREVFRRVVEGYLESGAPVGSRTLSKQLPLKASPATIRNVMQDLEEMGLLESPHVSAGRMPTERGLRLFVDALLEVVEISPEDRQAIEASVGYNGEDMSVLLDRASQALSEVTHGASLVLAPKMEAPIREVQLVPLSGDDALLVIVTEDGQVENRLFRLPGGEAPGAFEQAANFVNHIARGRTIGELRDILEEEIRRNRRELDELARKLVEAGLAVWQRDAGQEERLIVRGQANLLDDAEMLDNLDRVRELFDDLEKKRDIVEFLRLAEEGEGVRIFIGSENKLFSLSGSSLIVSPYMNADRKIVGAVGVIGPRRLNYGRILSIIDYTAQLVGRVLAGRS